MFSKMMLSTSSLQDCIFATAFRMFMRLGENPLGLDFVMDCWVPEERFPEAPVDVPVSLFDYPLCTTSQEMQRLSQPTKQDHVHI